MKRINWKWLLLIGGAFLFIGGDIMNGFAMKPGVQGTLNQSMNPALDAVKTVWSTYDLGEPVITSIMDGQHMVGSLHYAGLAVDIRLNDIAFDHYILQRDVQQLAGSAFQVIIEYEGTPNNHMHIEYDPQP